MNAQLPPGSDELVDADAIERFAGVVFGYLDGFVPVRALSENGTPHQRPESHFPSTDAVTAALRRLAPRAAKQSRGLYVVPGTVTAPGSARADEITSTGVLLVDLDECDIAAARGHLVRHLGVPTMEIASGGCCEDGQEKAHFYWRLTEPASGEDLERVRAAREAIAVKVGGDISFRSLHQPIRVAGTVHGKDGRRTPVRLVELRDNEYDLTELTEAVAAMPPLVSIPSQGFRIDVGLYAPTAATLATQVIRAGGVDGETRFGAISKVIGHWLRNVRCGRCTLDEAWTAVSDYNAAMISPPWESSALRREFDALMRKDIRTHGRFPEEATGATHGAGPLLIPLSDDALAARFVEDHGPGWRHVAAWGSWYGWSGSCWGRDETGQVRELVRQVCRAAAGDAEKPHEARRIASDKTIAAALRIATSDPRVAVGASDWDAHPFLLNTPAGVVDLETGEVLEHDAALLLTQITSASVGTGCRRWCEFLREITGGSAEIQAYLQRLAGYLLTGSTEEQMFAFFHGPGANGKSVFIQTLGAVLGDYAATATLDTFMASRTDRHLTELAGLRAARLVIVPETEAGRSWAEARIKSVTGGEKIRANFMHRDHFEFTPQFKLVVAGNHRPVLTGVGEAMRRRLHLVPFEVTIPPEARDRALAAKLLLERDGILGWMIEGFTEWRRLGLAPPPAVVAAAEMYFEAEDTVGQWMEECCVLGPRYRATSGALFASWSAWATKGGHAAGSQKALGEAFRERGLKDCKIARARGWLGIELRTSSSDGEASQ